MMPPDAVAAAAAAHRATRTAEAARRQALADLARHRRRSGSVSRAVARPAHVAATLARRAAGWTLGRAGGGAIAHALVPPGATAGCDCCPTP
jgi:hypothetical protein